MTERLLTRIYRALVRLVAILPPSGGFGASRSIAPPGARFGPFSVGQIVRVATDANCYYKFGDASVLVAADGDGTPLGAWGHVDHIIRDRDKDGFVHVRVVTAVGTGNANAFDTGGVNDE